MRPSLELCNRSPPRRDAKTDGLFAPRRTARDVYAWSRYTPLQDVKVVVLGQDPYHDDGALSYPLQLYPPTLADTRC